MSVQTKIDNWVWGQERIIWGYDLSHKYTFKLLEPKLGRAGCLSLQYHLEKSESWLIWRGVAWVLLVLDGQVCTRIMRQGQGQNIPAGVIHRIAAVSDDLQVLEPSTPDRHAADATIKKDIVRLDCLHGREVSQAADQQQAEIVQRARVLTEEALSLIEQGKLPLEYGRELFERFGAFQL